MIKIKLSIEEMKKLAEEKSGKCLSENYVNCKTKLRWQCKKGHEWEANPANVIIGCWCPKCAKLRVADKQRGNINEMQKIANERGGKCLSQNYLNNKTKLKWQCKKGHIWDSIPANIKRGKWCPKCYGNAKKTIGEMQKLAERKDGSCLSKEYFGTNIKLRWQCKEGHKWNATPHNIKIGTWCPICSHRKKLHILN